MKESNRRKELKPLKNLYISPGISPVGMFNSQRAHSSVSEILLTGAFESFFISGVLSRIS